jgi:hypothetical protein
MATYIYIGEKKGPGAGVPGLPHVVTDQEARVLGEEKTLAAAIERGVYKKATKGEVEKYLAEAEAARQAEAERNRHRTAEEREQEAAGPPPPEPPEKSEE